MRNELLVHSFPSCGGALFDAQLASNGNKRLGWGDEKLTLHLHPPPQRGEDKQIVNTDDPNQKYRPIRD